MRIKIRKDASKIYEDESIHFNRRWFDILKSIEGKSLTVDTNYLHHDQFTTVPIEGVSDVGLLIRSVWVLEVIDDVRPGKGRCGYCGKTVEDGSNHHCPHCKVFGHVKAF
jgi:rubrerythrin